MRIRTGFIGLQFSDTDKQHTSDIERLFDRAIDRRYAWFMGTEAGDGAGNTQDELLRVGEDAGYRMYVPGSREAGPGSATDCWIGVREDLIEGGWDTEYIEAIPGSNQLYAERGVDVKFPKWGPKGLVTVGFNSIPQLGRVNLGAAHHLTGGREAGAKAIQHGIDHYKLNEDLDRVITKWMREVGKGPDLAFASMDRNASDRSSQSIAGTESLADELKKWKSTGHGDIDWMLSYKKDSRVKGVKWVVLNDKQFRLHTDHFLCEGTYSVEAINTTR